MHIALQAVSGAIVTWPLSFALPFVNRGGVFRRVLSHLVVIGVAAFLWNIFRMATFDAMIGASDIWKDFGGWYFTALLIFGLWATLYYSVKAYVAVEVERKHVETERLRRVEAENLSREAQMMMLRYQVNPHFLFNTLNSISALIKTNRSQQAREMISQLSEFMRYTLENNEIMMTSLDDELAMLSTYLDIERVRYGDRLTIEFLIDEETRSAAVPPMILQPFFENTMKYVIAGTVSGGLIRLSARLNDGNIYITMEDSGHPDNQHDQSLAANIKKGVGLQNIEDRLKMSYTDQAIMKLSLSELGGLKVDMQFPFQSMNDALLV